MILRCSLSIFFWQLLIHREHVHLFDWRCWQRRLLSSLGTMHWNRDKGCHSGCLGSASSLILGWVAPTGCFCVLFFFSYHLLRPSLYLPCVQSLSICLGVALLGLSVIIKHPGQRCFLGREERSWDKEAKVLLYVLYKTPAWALGSVCQYAIWWRLS